MRQIARLLNGFLPLILLGVFLLVAGCTGQERAREEANKAVVLRLFEEFWNKGNLAVLDELAAPGFVHQENLETRSLEAYRALYAGLPDAYPGSHYTLQDVIVGERKVVILWTWSGTMAKTGEKVTGLPGITIFRVADGKIEKILSCYDTTPLK